jgi:iron only hydrogenase large subunit-like protein
VASPHQQWIADCTTELSKHPACGRLTDSHCLSCLGYAPRTDAIALKIKQEFAAKEKTQTAKKTVAKSQPKAVKKAKAA